MSYDRKHNEANGEDNRDGSDHNLSWNCGVEGDTDLLVVTTLRNKLSRALLATLMLSRGVPMLLGGDEIGRTQRGNNNAYAHDSAVSWYDWSRVDLPLLAFTARLIALRKSTPQLCTGRWLTGRPDNHGRRDVAWLDRNGQEMQSHQWDGSNRFVLGMQLNDVRRSASAAPAPPLLALFNAEHSDWSFPLPPGRWRWCFDTALPDPFSVAGTAIETATVVQHSRSVVLLTGVVDETG